MKNKVVSAPTTCKEIVIAMIKPLFSGVIDLRLFKKLNQSQPR